VKRKVVITIGVVIVGLSLVCSVVLGGVFLSDLYTHVKAEFLERRAILREYFPPEADTASDPLGDVPGPTRTPSPIGLSRRSPYPRSEIAVAPHWEVQVLETVRGVRAWQALQEANQFNMPAPPGREYLIVRVRVTCTYADREAHAIGENDFRVTGSHLIEYFTANAVAPDPVLDAELYKGEVAEGWAVYLVGQDERSLILIIDELADYDEDQRRFIALDAGASFTVPSELAYIEPTILGATREAPAPFGAMVTTEDWQVRVLETIRGEAAWLMVHNANQFNKPPAEGMEYVLVRLYVRYIGTRDEPESIRESYFEAMGSTNVAYEMPSVVDPAPKLDARLFPGGEFEGWVTLQVAQDEPNIVAMFEPWLSLSDVNRRFLSLTP
jgi:hypothetical protein